MNTEESTEPEGHCPSESPVGLTMNDMKSCFQEMLMTMVSASRKETQPAAAPENIYRCLAPPVDVKAGDESNDHFLLDPLRVGNLDLFRKFNDALALAAHEIVLHRFETKRDDELVEFTEVPKPKKSEETEEPEKEERKKKAPPASSTAEFLHSEQCFDLTTLLYNLDRWNNENGRAEWRWQLHPVDRVNLQARSITSATLNSLLHSIRFKRNDYSHGKHLGMADDRNGARSRKCMSKDVLLGHVLRSIAFIRPYMIHLQHAPLDRQFAVMESIHSLIIGDYSDAWSRQKSVLSIIRGLLREMPSSLTNNIGAAILDAWGDRIKQLAEALRSDGSLDQRQCAAYLLGSYTRCPLEPIRDVSGGQIPTDLANQSPVHKRGTHVPTDPMPVMVPGTLDSVSNTLQRSTLRPGPSKTSARPRGRPTGDLLAATMMKKPVVGSVVADTDESEAVEKMIAEVDDAKITEWVKELIMDDDPEQVVHIVDAFAADKEFENHADARAKLHAAVIPKMLMHAPKLTQSIHAKNLVKYIKFVRDLEGGALCDVKTLEAALGEAIVLIMKQQSMKALETVTHLAVGSFQTLGLPATPLASVKDTALWQGIIPELIKLDDEYRAGAWLAVGGVDLHAVLEAKKGYSGLKDALATLDDVTERRAADVAQTYMVVKLTEALPAALASGAEPLKAMGASYNDGMTAFSSYAKQEGHKAFTVVDALKVCLELGGEHSVESFKEADRVFEALGCPAGQLVAACDVLKEGPAADHYKDYLAVVRMPGFGQNRTIKAELVQQEIGQEAASSPLAVVPSDSTLPHQAHNAATLSPPHIAAAPSRPPEPAWNNLNSILWTMANSIAEDKTPSFPTMSISLPSTSRRYDRHYICAYFSNCRNATCTFLHPKDFPSNTTPFDIIAIFVESQSRKDENLGKKFPRGMCNHCSTARCKLGKNHGPCVEFQHWEPNIKFIAKGLIETGEHTEWNDELTYALFVELEENLLTFCDDFFAH